MRLSGVLATFGVALRTCRAEGVAAVRDRLFDRWRESRQAVRADVAGVGDWPVTSILNVIGAPVTARGGGVPLQLRARLAHERAQRPVALFSRDPRGWRLDGWSGESRMAQMFATGEWSGDPLADESGWVDAVRGAVDRIGARAIHVENLAGLSLVSLLALTRGDQPLIVSMHDFSAFCQRPHLWRSTGGFCHYSQDEAQCHRCLTAASTAVAIDQLRHRAVAADVLGAAAAVICPSQFLIDRLAELTPWKGDGTRDVIAPGVDYAATPRSSRRPDQVAFIGGGANHKGGARLPAIARALAARGVNVTVYGGNGLENLLQLRATPGVRVRGYVRAGSLPANLARQGAAVALLLPAVPESFSLALSDAWAAGVPVVAPAQGALAERLRQGGGSRLSPDPSDGEIVSAIERLRQTPIGELPSPPTARDAAVRHLALYRRGGWLTDA